MCVCVCVCVCAVNRSQSPEPAGQVSPVVTRGREAVGGGIVVQGETVVCLVSARVVVYAAQRVAFEHLPRGMEHESACAASERHTILSCWNNRNEGEMKKLPTASTRVECKARQFLSSAWRRSSGIVLALHQSAYRS